MDQGKLRVGSGKSKTTGQDHTVVKNLLKISSKFLMQSSGGRKSEQDEAAQLLPNGFVRQHQIADRWVPTMQAHRPVNLESA